MVTLTTLNQSWFMLLTCITYLSNPYSFLVTLGFAVWSIYLQWGELICFLFCVVLCPCRLPQFSAFTLPVVFKSQGVTLFWGCPHISLLILMLVTWGFGELANKSIPKSITLADKLNGAVLWVEYGLYEKEELLTTSFQPWKFQPRN